LQRGVNRSDLDRTRIWRTATLQFGTRIPARKPDFAPLLLLLPSNLYRTKHGWAASDVADAFAVIR
jgi:hypothetical protein